MVRDLTGEGTPEARWRPSLDRLDELTLTVPASGQVTVVAPHPDDEVFGAGAAMRLLVRAGADLTVIAVTDGEASHPRSPTTSADQLIQRRRLERSVALDRLGLPGDVRVVRLSLPDGNVGRYERRLADTLTDHLGEGELCLAPWPYDGHPDHDATGRAATVAAEHTGCELLGFLVWLWHWADPADPELPWRRMRRLPLSADCAEAKRLAATAFTTQVRPLSAHPEDQPVLPPSVLRRLTREHEVFVT